MATTPQYNFTVTLDDLAFILKQIKIAEASTDPLTGAIQNLPQLVGSPLLPYGLRTVDGSWNSLLPGMERLGAADNVMPRLVPGVFDAAEGRPANFFGPGDPGSTASSYDQSEPGNLVWCSRAPPTAPVPGLRHPRQCRRRSPRPHQHHHPRSSIHHWGIASCLVKRMARTIRSAK